MIGRNGKQYPNPTYQQTMDAWCLLNDLIKLGYPHDFQKELPHIRSYMWKVTGLVRNAIHIRDGRENEVALEVLDVSGGRMNGKVEFTKAVNEMMQEAYIQVPRKNGKTMFNAPTEDVEPQRKGEKNVGWQPETQPKGKPPAEKTKVSETMQRLVDANALIAPLKEEYKSIKQAFDETSVFQAPNDAALYGALMQEVGAVIGMIEDAKTIDAIPLDGSFLKMSKGDYLIYNRHWLYEHFDQEINIERSAMKSMGYEPAIKDVEPRIPLPKPYKGEGK